MTRGHLFVLFVFFVVSLVALSGGVVADENTTADYTIEATTSIDTPQRTLTIIGRDFNVSSLGRVKTGSVIRASVARPGNGDFRILLYSYDGERITTVEGNENGTYTLDGTDSLDSGTYLLALSIDRSFEKVQPVVVSGYDFSVDAPADASPEESVSVDVQLTGDAPLPTYIELVVMNDSMHRYTMAHLVDTREYTVLVGDLQPGEYRLYASAHNDSQIAGASSVQTLTIAESESESTPTPTTTSDEPTTARTPGQSGGLAGQSPATPSGGGVTPSVESPAVSPAATQSPVTPSRTQRSPALTTPKPTQRTSDPVDASGGAADPNPTVDTQSIASTTDGSSRLSGTPVATPGFTAVTTLLGIAVLLFTGLRD
ncbi:hypothetical protein [Halobellus rubicundus]|uniref:Cell surface glycoprotein n=1 Tax=Halobellus rubicundus TaxID=2996466 RepID=A0ABD5MGZ4_9EURY